MLTNIVSPPTAGTSLAHRIVAIGGSARNVSSECQTSVPNGGVVSSFLNLISSGAFLPSFGANGCTVSVVEAPAERHQIVGRDVLIAEDDQFVLDQRSLDRIELLVRQAAAQDRHR